MAKTYLSTVKYLIHTKFEINGLVDKHDIVGAIFGQSEGLIGEDMDLRELQKNGKIGRFEVKTSAVMVKTIGELSAPTSLDMAQTAILAAAIESIDKVGPFDCKFETISIEDVREEKRMKLKDRAKELLKKFMAEELPESHELAEEIREDARALELKSFGKEKLPCGPELEKSDEIIVVEGRADVLTLLRNNLKNVVALNGSIIPKTVIDLSKKKSVTLFVDGDRGGDLIIRHFWEKKKHNLMQEPQEEKK